ncbi:hypothetical protein TW78_00925 [Vibrio coralliilyticus]|uniref:Uncharacterized protein n=1 Tax=Vibrio coralliilyticus TaxID=190893 RepID=A0A837G3V2_9VIBR|nr:hypothetical protein TW78_00925 [Vibrio coralliilyticus]
MDLIRRLFGYEFLVPFLVTCLIYGMLFVFVYFVYKVVRSYIVKFYVSSSLDSETKQNIDRIIALAKIINVPGELPDNYQSLWSSIYKNKNQRESMKSSIGIFELTIHNYKKSGRETTDLLEVIDLLDGFKVQALRQKKFFYETNEAINISLSYLLVSKHFLVSNDSL